MNLGRGHANADGDVVVVLAAERHVRGGTDCDFSLHDGLLVDREGNLFRSVLLAGILGSFDGERIPCDRGDSPGDGLELRRLSRADFLLQARERSVIRRNRGASRSADRQDGNRGERFAERIHNDLRTILQWFDACGVVPDSLGICGSSCTADQAKAGQILPLHHHFYKDRQYSNEDNEMLNCSSEIGFASSQGGYAAAVHESATGSPSAQGLPGTNVSRAD